MRADNAQAMRGALVSIADICDGADTGGLDERMAIYNIAQTALYFAPLRNCDRLGGDIDKLREACARERGMNPEEDFPEVFAEWLLAPSTERKGDGDASK